jgi:hypothetical protein
MTAEQIRTPEVIRADYWHKIEEFHRAGDDGMPHGCYDAAERAARQEAHDQGREIGLTPADVDELIRTPPPK